MATTPTKPDLAVTASLTTVSVPAWPRGGGSDADISAEIAEFSAQEFASQKPSQRNALHALLAFSALHDQVRRRKALAARHNGFDAGVLHAEFDHDEQFVLDEVLQLVAERAIAITGADGIAIALAENNEIVLRASAGTVKPDIGARIDRDSAFSGACFNSAQIVNCDDTELDPRVNLEACRKLGARSMVAVPLCGRRRVIGVLEAFSSWPFGFNDSDVRNLSLLAELVLGALKPEDEDRFALSAEAAATKLLVPSPAPVEPPKPITPAPSAQVIAKPVAAETKLPVPVVPPKPVAPTVAPVIAATAPATPVIAKPVAAEIKVATAAPAILDNPAVEPEKAPAVEGQVEEKIEEKAAAETATQPVLTFGQSAPEARQRPFMLVLLVCIVVATAFAAGVWWKLKTAQLGSVMVKTETMHKPAPKPADAAATVATADTTTSVAANPAETAAPDSTADVNAPMSAPATPQELSKFPRVTGIRHWSSADTSTVVLDLEDQVQYEPGHLTNPDRVYFDLRDTQLAAELQGKSLDVGDTLLSRIRMAQPVPGMTRVVLEAKGGATLSRPQVSLERDPYRLVIQVTKAGTTPKAAVSLFPNAVEPQKNKLAIVVPPPTKEDMQLRTHVPKMRIVVDAGHGGWDLGTVGRRGLLEKDLVLEIAQRLGKLLETRLGSEVIYTRPDDNYITLDDRANIANTAQADLFVSVHANYSDLPSARGVETYYTNFFSAPGAKIVNTQATTATKTTTPTLSPSDLHERIEQSRRLATSVQRSLYGTLSVQNPGLRDRGIKEAGFVVLTESAMPGILAEVSFVSSPTDEQKLRSDGYREQIAEALYKGIARYAASSRGVKVASAGK
jgi:N-acetylmuramoyl-L-alanine amidase/putative methionine-R-sulfoxide reductase with GAF domain